MNQLIVKVFVGFRFYFIDEEFVGYYFFMRVIVCKVEFDFICDLDLYKLELWDF